MSELKEKVILEIKKIYDPEIPVNIYELGLIYNIDISKEGKVDVLMTLTSPFCPAAGEIINDVMGAAYNAGATGVEVDITFHPEWGPDKISDEGKLELGIF
jgi:metal-sulfur cluster biosynthetic enzyme